MADPRASVPIADPAPGEFRKAELQDSIEIEAELAENRRFTRRVVLYSVVLGTLVYAMFN